jgi:hypothetical protein
VIAYANITLGRGGLPMCRRCAVQSRASVRARVDVLGDLEAVASTWRDGPGPNVCLTGTEAFRYAELPEVLEAAEELGIARVGLETAGVGLAENAGAALAAGVRRLDYVAVAADERSERVLTGEGRATSEGLAALAAFCGVARSRRIPALVTARVPVCRHNLDAVPDIVAAVSAAGATSIALVLDDDVRTVQGWAERCTAAMDVGIVTGVWTYAQLDEDSPELPASATALPFVGVAAS